MMSTEAEGGNGGREGGKEGRSGVKEGRLSQFGSSERRSAEAQS